MAFVRALIAAVASIWLGVGTGLAALGRPWRGAAWAAVLVIALAFTSLSVWFFVVAAAILVGSFVDTFICGYRSTAEPPFRWFQKSTILIVLVFVGSALVLRGFVVEAFNSPSTSMAPTLEIGDR